MVIMISSYNFWLRVEFCVSCVQYCVFFKCLIFCFLRMHLHRHEYEYRSGFLFMVGLLKLHSYE